MLTGILACGPPQPLLVGALIPESGAASSYGRSIRRGMELALEEINANGGVLGGRELTIEFHDTGTDPVTAEIAAREMMDRGIQIVIGAGASPVSLHLVPLFNKRNVLLVSPSSSSPRLTKEGGDWFFRIYPSDVGEAFRMATFCRENVISRVAVVSVMDSFGEGAADEFVKKYEASTRDVVYRKDFEGSLTDESAQRIVAEMKKSNPEAVYIAAYVDDTATLLRAIDRARLKVARLGTSAITKELVEMAGSAADGIVFPTPSFDPTTSKDPTLKAFVEAYRNKFGEDPDLFSLKGHEVTNVVAQAIDVARLPNSKNIRDALLTSEFRVVSGTIQFNLSGDVTQPLKIYAINNGQIVDYDTYREAMVSKSILAR